MRVESIPGAARKFAAATDEASAKAALTEAVVSARTEANRVASELDKLRGGSGYETLPDFIARTGGAEDADAALKRATDAGYEATAKDIADGNPILRPEDQPKADAMAEAYTAMAAAARGPDPARGPDDVKKAIRDHNATTDRAPSEVEAMSQMDRLAAESDAVGDDVALSESLTNDTLETLEVLDAMDEATSDAIAKVNSDAASSGEARRALINCLMGWAKP